VLETLVVNFVFIAVGIFGVGWILNDIFKQVLVPRAVEGPVRISVLFARFAWNLGRPIALGMKNATRREELLGLFAPLYFILLLGLWLAGLILSYGLILYGLRDEIHPVPTDLPTALYFAATSVLTIGYGDFVATQAPARIVAIFGGASGIGTVAVAITFLYAIIGAFQKRERFVVVLDARAGAPPSGVALLETYAALGMLPELNALFRDSEGWVADVLNSHLAYPILMSFRSSHKDESWIAALGALLDAAALLVTVVDGVRTGEARLFLDVGMHLTHDLNAYFDLPSSGDTRASASEQEAICSRLTAVGFRVREDRERWDQFNQLRESYRRPLLGIGARWLHTNAQLIGERTALPGHAS
jgi:ion channel